MCHGFGLVWLGLVTDGTLRSDPDNVLEERDPKYDAMLGQMVGRIQSKPGGKLEMGEVSLLKIQSNWFVIFQS